MNFRHSTQIRESECSRPKITALPMKPSGWVPLDILSKKERMTWIKPSFFWMMYISGWAEKENQERILAIDISLKGFEDILKETVISHFDDTLYSDRSQRKQNLESSEVRFQFDPARDIRGNPLERRAIQPGLKGYFVERYINNGSRI